MRGKFFCNNETILGSRHFLHQGVIKYFFNFKELSEFRHLFREKFLQRVLKWISPGKSFIGVCVLAQESVCEGKVIFFCEPILGVRRILLSFIEVGKLYEFHRIE